MTDLGLTLRQTSKPASITPNIHMRLNKVIKELNVSIQRVADTLKDHGIDGEITLNTKITEEQYETLKKTFADDINRKEEAEKRFHNRREDKRAAKESDAAPAVGDGQDEAKDAPAPKAETSSAPAEPSVQEAPAAQEVAAAEADNNAEGGLKVVGHIDLDAFKKPAKKTKEKVAKAEPKAEPKAKVEKKEPAAEAPKAEPAPQEAPAAEVKAAEPAAPVENAQKETAAEAAPAEAASALGAENGDGVFKLNSEPRLTGPKVLGTVDLSAINGSTRPKSARKSAMARSATASATNVWM